jgi:hypothetical protein
LSVIVSRYSENIFWKGWKMKKILLAVLMMSLFAGVSSASVIWGSVTASSMNAVSYEIVIAQDSTVIWRTEEHIAEDYGSCSLDAGYYDVRCTIYDDHGMPLDGQVRHPYLPPGTFLECSFVFSAKSLDSSTWGSIKATIQ